MREIFFFERMLTPNIIQFVYWLLLVVIVISGLGTMFTGGVAGFFGGLVMIVIGAVFARIWCELLIVLFKMNDALQTLRDK